MEREGNINDISSINNKSSKSFINDYENSLKQLDDMDDPMIVCCNYVDFLISSSKTGLPESLKTSIKNIIDIFVNDLRYKNDLRYLNLWLLLSKYEDSPLEIFEFLISKNIAQDLALFYIQYGACLEFYSLFVEANKTYEMGIQRCAAPLNRLILKHKEFLQRMHEKKISVSEKISTRIDKNLISGYLKQEKNDGNEVSFEELRSKLDKYNTESLFSPSSESSSVLKENISFDFEDNEEIGVDEIEKTCTMVQLPVAKLVFEKLEVFKDNSVSKKIIGKRADIKQQLSSRQPLAPKKSSGKDDLSSETISPSLQTKSVVEELSDDLTERNGIDDFESAFDELQIKEDNEYDSQEDCSSKADYSSTSFSLMQRNNNISSSVILWKNNEIIKGIIERKLVECSNFFSMSGNISKIEVPSQIHLGNSVFLIQEKIGTGGFSDIFLAIDLSKEMHSPYAMKISSEKCCWEFYILSVIQERTNSFEDIKFFKFENTGILLEPLNSFGTLLDCLNMYKAPGVGLDELLCFFFCLELLHAVIRLHRVGIIHGDIKVDNVMLQFSKNPTVQLIDFERSIDTFEIPGTFQTRFSKKDDILDVRLQTSFHFDIDAVGIAGVAYTLLFGDYFKVKDNFFNCNIEQYIESNNIPLKRYHNIDLWKEFFLELLVKFPNHKSTPSKVESLEKLALKLRKYLDLNKERNGKSLKSMLRKIANRE